MECKSQKTPKDFFHERYGHSAMWVEARSRKRIDIPEVLSDTNPKGAQEFYDSIAIHIRSLLTEDEANTLGDFYYGLTAEFLVSSSIESVGTSYLVLIHRRLSNAIQFLSEALASTYTISDQDKIQIIGQYIYLLAKDIASPREFPQTPPLPTEEEGIVMAMLNSGLARYVLCHELCHVMPATTCHGVNVVAVLREAFGVVNHAWQRELTADFQATCLILREDTLDNVLADNYFRHSIMCPIIFCLFLETLEHTKRKMNPELQSVDCDHPPSALRVQILRKLFIEAFPSRDLFIRESVSLLQDIFKMVVRSIDMHHLKNKG